MKRIIALICLIITLVPNLAWAYAFDKNNIISDSDLTDSSAMSLARIQEFLTSKGVLGQYSVNVNGALKSAALIIYEVANQFRLNPKFILATLEKEQTLIDDSSLSQYQLDWAMGYSCKDDGTRDETKKGFYNQIYYSANRIRSDAYLSGLESGGTTISGWAPGITKIVNCSRGCGLPQGNYIDIAVTPTNNATAVLYTYTPHVDGNYSFWTIWSNWFLKRYTNGSLLRVNGEKGIWLIRAGKRYNFVSYSAFIFSYDPKKVIDVSLNDLQAYEYGAPIKFAEYSLLQAPSGGIYLLINGEKRPITSYEAFRKLGYSPEEVIKVTWEDLTAYPTGEKITPETTNPTGILLQSKQTGGIYYIANGYKSAIFSREILLSQFARRKWTTVDQSEIDKYPSAEPVKFRDGELVTSPSANGIYLIADGQKHPIPSQEIFNGMGFKWSNIIKTTDRALEIHQTGDRIDYLTQ